MNRTSRSQERKILELYFQGYSHGTIGVQLGVPPSTVSEVIRLLPEGLAFLRELSVEIKKYDLTIFKAKEGVKLHTKLLEQGIGLNQLKNYVESIEKIGKDPQFEPRKIVQVAMRLSNLEQESGKTYSETLRDFREKARVIRKQEKKERDLKEKVGKLKVKLRRRRAETKVTEKELAYNANLRRDLRRYGTETSDVADLREFLRNMRETGGSPRRFIEYTRQHGSLKRRVACLRQKEQAHSRTLNSLIEKEKAVKTHIQSSLSAKSELDRQNNQERIRLQSTREENARAIATRKAELVKLNSEINERKARIQHLQQTEQELDEKNKKTEQEIETKLRIEDYATQLQSAITNLECRKLSLDKYVVDKQERVALVDTLTAFLIRQAPYDFNQLYFYVEQIKKTRESGTYQTGLLPTVFEEQTRMLALGAFKGHLVTTADYQILKMKKDESEEAKAELETKISQLSSKLDTLEKEKQFLEAVRVNFEGKTVTLGELRNWVLSTFSEEIERRVEEKLYMYATAAVGVLNFVHKKITRKDDSSKED